MKRFSQNFLSIISSDIGRRLLGFLAVTYLARTVGTANFGAINVGFTVLSYALMASSGGLNSFGTRSVAQGALPTIVNDILSVRLITSSLSFGIVAFIAFYFVPNKLTATLIVLFNVSLFVQAVLLEWYFQGREEMTMIGFSRVASAVLYLFLLLLVVQSAENLLWVALASVAGDTLAAAILYFTFKRKQSDFHFIFNLSRWKSLFIEAFPIGLGSMMAHFSVNLAPLALGILMTNSDVGIYSAASKLIFFLLMFDRVLSTLLLPASSRLHIYSPDQLSRVLSTAMKWIILIALPVCIGGTLLADTIVPLVYGRQYLPAVDIFRILIWYLLFTMLHTMYSIGLLAIGKEKIYSKVMVISMMLYGGTIILGIMFFGVAGAALGVMVSEFVTLCLMRLEFERLVTLSLPEGTANVVAATLLMGVVLLVLPSIHIVLSILIGSTIYFVTLFATRAITFEEITTLLRRV
ncbi:MAG: flippase [Ignavibacteriae bacterium]|nr:flippase [Ignavibacteriota bacterium]